MAGLGDRTRIEDVAKAEIVNKKEKEINAGRNDNHTQWQGRESEEPIADSDADAGHRPNGVVDGEVRSGDSA